MCLCLPYFLTLCVSFKGLIVCLVLIIVWCLSFSLMPLISSLGSTWSTKLYEPLCLLHWNSALTEKLVRVLQGMQCPHRLEPHQMSLQGMDFIHIFPVIQWLVKKSIEFRAVSEERIKMFAVRRFNHFQRNQQQVLSVNCLLSNTCTSPSLSSVQMTWIVRVSSVSITLTL